METEILKFILSNRGSVNTEELLYNLCDASTLEELVKNDKFVPCVFSGQPKILVRTRMKLCWVKDCPGCGGLHVCKGYLFTGDCQYNQTRRGCIFCHDLHSDYNKRILQEFGLETLTLTELCHLLLQSKNTLLPMICHNYNNRGGCQDDCQRLHICERSFNRDCSCFRNHDFNSPQPLKRLQEKRIPDNIIQTLKYVYANKQTLWDYDKNQNTEPGENSGNESDSSNTSETSTKQNKTGFREGGRGRGSHRGNRGGRGRGNWGNKQQEGACSHSSQDPNNTRERSSILSADQSQNAKNGNWRGSRGGWSKREHVGHRGGGNRGGRGGRGIRGRDNWGSTCDLPGASNAFDYTSQKRYSEENDGRDSDSSSTSKNGGNCGGQGKRGHLGRGKRGGRSNRGKDNDSDLLGASNAFDTSGYDLNSQNDGSNSDSSSIDQNVKDGGEYGGNCGDRGKTGLEGYRGGGNRGSKQQGRKLHQMLGGTNTDHLKNEFQPIISGPIGFMCPPNLQANPNLQYNNQAYTNLMGNCIVDFSSTNLKDGFSNGGTQGNVDKMQNKPVLLNLPATVNNSEGKPRRGPRDKTEICIFFIKGHCMHKDRCFRIHDTLPYRWETKKDGRWIPMAENEEIERDYCDPENTYSTSSPLVHFDTMICGEGEVRRLSSISSVLQPACPHTTEWQWFWEDESGKWNHYVPVISEHQLAGVSSKDLEEMFVKNDKVVVQIKTGSQNYQLNFEDMIQTNLNDGTKRFVRRRPRFVSAAEVQTKRKHPANVTAIPDYWDKTLIPQTGYKRVAMQDSSDEYKEIQDLFCKTMSGFDILQIERIQNKSIWEDFQLQKNDLQNGNGGRPVTEKKLFHGTDPKSVDSICASNFDRRVCEVNGTDFGQGIYFACDASYSHNYTGDFDVRSMFLSRVLVGDFTKGRSEYTRPPSKDSGDVNLFDSCVDDVTEPSIFVVFEKKQIYPEYLLQYEENLYT